jgi:hypothetical protein
MNQLRFFTLKGFLSLFRGVQAVIYGYFFSSMVYFYAYAKFKDLFKSSDETRARSLIGTLLTSFFASALAESFALVFYYPFDLIKTRM